MFNKKAQPKQVSIHSGDLHHSLFCGKVDFLVTLHCSVKIKKCKFVSVL